MYLITSDKNKYRNVNGSQTIKKNLDNFEILTVIMGIGLRVNLSSSQVHCSILARLINP